MQIYFEQRKNARLGCRAIVTLHNDTSTWQTLLSDVSRTGLRVRRPNGWLTGDHLSHCEIMIGKRFSMAINARVIYDNRHFIGLSASHKDLPDLYNLLLLLAKQSARKSAASRNAL